MLRGQEARSLVACFFFGHRPLSLTALSGSLRYVGCPRRAKQTPSHCERWATLQCAPCFFLHNAIIYIRQSHNGNSSATSISSFMTGPMYLIVISQKETFLKNSLKIMPLFWLALVKTQDSLLTSSSVCTSGLDWIEVAHLYWTSHFPNMATQRAQPIPPTYYPVNLSLSRCQFFSLWTKAAYGSGIVTAFDWGR